ncbi:unnamed protein product [Protopolystoma xenopodis]|uniref:Uncharacterized protein n=1 Tax=Protopolystoma xenopodis TaxID=117903 RepID=A0A448XT04_9PLAT|nr:unnamed protein product [Protopolystoma xenopodis]
MRRPRRGGLMIADRECCFPAGSAAQGRAVSIGTHEASKCVGPNETKVGRTHELLCTYVRDNVCYIACLYAGASEREDSTSDLDGLCECACACTNANARVRERFVLE